MIRLYRRHKARKALLHLALSCADSRPALSLTALRLLRAL